MRTDVNDLKVNDLTPIEQRLELLELINESDTSDRSVVSASCQIQGEQRLDVSSCVFLIE